MRCGGALEDLFAASYSVGPSRCDLSFQIMRASFFCQNKGQSSQLMARLLLAMSVVVGLIAGEVAIAEEGGGRRHIFEQ